MPGEALGSRSGVSRKTGIQNRLVLTHPLLKGPWGLSNIEPPVALSMIRELRQHSHNTSTGMGDKTKVKGPMGNFPAFI